MPMPLMIVGGARPVPAVAGIHYNRGMFSRTLRGILLAWFAFPLVGCINAADKHPPSTVAHVDLSRYAGRWYEIARIPRWYEHDCANSTADYTPIGEGRLKVVNACVSAKSGKEKRVEGIAHVVD